MCSWVIAGLGTNSGSLLRRRRYGRSAKVSTRVTPARARAGGGIVLGDFAVGFWARTKGACQIPGNLESVVVPAFAVRDARVSLRPALLANPVSGMGARSVQDFGR